MTETKQYTGSEFLDGFEQKYARLSYEGYGLPHVVAVRNHPTKDEWMLLIDNRLGFETFTEEEIKKLIGVLANCMAVAAGYSCHGENCTPLNPHKVVLCGVRLPTKLTPIDGGKK